MSTEDQDRKALRKMLAGIPEVGGDLASSLYTPAERAELDADAKKIAEGFMEANRAARQVIELSPALERWYTPEYLDLLPGAYLTVDGSIICINDFCEPLGIERLFSEVVVSGETFKCVILFFAWAAHQLQPRGFMDEQYRFVPGQEAAMREFYLSELTTALVNYVPGLFVPVQLRAKLEQILTKF